MNTIPKTEIIPPPPEIKPGWQTTEFWMAAVTSVIVLLNSAFDWHIDPVSIATVAGMIAAYALSRMGVKRASTLTASTGSGTVTATVKP